MILSPKTLFSYYTCSIKFFIFHQSLKVTKSSHVMELDLLGWHYTRQGDHIFTSKWGLRASDNILFTQYPEEGNVLLRKRFCTRFPLLRYAEKETVGKQE